MSDSAICEIKTEGGSLYLYSHFDGMYCPENAMSAITFAAHRIKNKDYSYATRIIISQLTKEATNLEGGFGLSLTPHCHDAYNNDKPSIVINLLKEELIIARYGKLKVIPFCNIHNFTKSANAS